MEETKKEGAPAAEAQPTASKEDVDKNKGMAIVAYLIFFIPLLTDAKESPFAKYHVKQGLMLFIFYMVGYIAAGVLSIVLIGLLLMPIIGIASLVFLIMGIMNAANGKMKPLPLIGGLAEKWFTF